MLVRLLVEVDMFSVVPHYGLEKEKTIFFYIKCHDSYLMKCLHNNISQNVSYKRKYVHKLLVNRLFKPAQEKVWLD